MGSDNRVIVERKESPSTENFKELDKGANSLTCRARKENEKLEELEISVEKRLVVNVNIITIESD